MFQARQSTKRRTSSARVDLPRHVEMRAAERKTRSIVDDARLRKHERARLQPRAAENLAERDQPVAEAGDAGRGETNPVAIEMKPVRLRPEAGVDLGTAWQAAFGEERRLAGEEPGGKRGDGIKGGAGRRRAFGEAQGARQIPRAFDRDDGGMRDDRDRRRSLGSGPVGAGAATALPERRRASSE